MILPPSKLNRVVLGDSIGYVSSLPESCIGAVVSDPPFFTTIGRNEGDTGGMGDDPWNDIGSIEAATAWCRPHMQEYRRVVRKGGAIVVMAGVHAVSAWMQAAEEAGLSWMAELVILWNTGKPRALNFGSLHTHVLWFSRPGARHTWNWRSRAIFSNILVAKKIPIQHREHIAQKPIELTTFLISLLTRYDDVVLDPFCGSGSTLVSAAILDRPFIGIDQDKHSCIISRRRASQWEVQEEDRLYLWSNNKLIDVTIDHS